MPPADEDNRGVRVEDLRGDLARAYDANPPQPTDYSTCREHGRYRDSHACPQCFPADYEDDEDTEIDAWRAHLKHIAPEVARRWLSGEWTDTAHLDERTAESRPLSAVITPDLARRHATVQRLRDLATLVDDPAIAYKFKETVSPARRDAGWGPWHRVTLEWRRKAK